MIVKAPQLAAIEIVDEKSALGQTGQVITFGAQGFEHSLFHHSRR